MRHLKTYNESVDDQYEINQWVKYAMVDSKWIVPDIDQKAKEMISFIEVVDDVMLTFVDDGFMESNVSVCEVPVNAQSPEEVEGVMIIKRYHKPSTDTNSGYEVIIDGIFKGGVPELHHRKFNPILVDIVEEFENAINLINGVSGRDFQFRLTNCGYNDIRITISLFELFSYICINN